MPGRGQVPVQFANRALQRPDPGRQFTDLVVTGEPHPTEGPIDLVLHQCGDGLPVAPTLHEQVVGKRGDLAGRGLALSDKRFRGAHRPLPSHLAEPTG